VMASRYSHDFAVAVSAMHDFIGRASKKFEAAFSIGCAYSPSAIWAMAMALQRRNPEVGCPALV